MIIPESFPLLQSRPEISKPSSFFPLFQLFLLWITLSSRFLFSSKDLLSPKALCYYSQCSPCSLQKPPLFSLASFSRNLLCSDFSFRFSLQSLNIQLPPPPKKTLLEKYLQRPAPRPASHNCLTPLPCSCHPQRFSAFFCWKKSPCVQLSLANKAISLIPYQPVLEWHVAIPNDDTCHNRAVEMSPQNGGLQTCYSSMTSKFTKLNGRQILSSDSKY